MVRRTKVLIPPPLARDFSTVLRAATGCRGVRFRALELSAGFWIQAVKGRLRAARPRANHKQQAPISSNQTVEGSGTGSTYAFV